MAKRITWQEIQNGEVINQHERGTTYHVPGVGLVWLKPDLVREISNANVHCILYPPHELEYGLIGAIFWEVVNIVEAEDIIEADDATVD